MKISKFTFDVLKNFSGINAGMYQDEVGVLKIISPAKSIIGIADIEEKFPKFAIYNMQEWNSSMSILAGNDVDVEFGESDVVMTDGGIRINYRLSSPETIRDILTKTSESVKEFKDFDFNFTFKYDDYIKLSKACSIFNLKIIKITFADNKGVITLYDKDNALSHKFSIDFEGKGNDGEVILSLGDDSKQSFQLLSGDYEVYIKNNTVAKFVHKEKPLFYLLAAAKNI